MITKQFSSNVCTITRPLALTHLFKGLVTKHATVKWTIMHLNADCIIIRVYFPSQPVDCLKENSQITICWQSLVVRDTWEQYIDFGVLHPVWTVSCEITQKCWGCKPISWLVVLPLESKSKFSSKEIINAYSNLKHLIQSISLSVLLLILSLDFFTSWRRWPSKDMV